MRNLLILLSCCLSLSVFAQNLEVEGKAKITQMDKVNTADSIVVWLQDSTLGIRDAASINRQLIDSDGDTRVLVEENPDDDIIRFYANGTQTMRIGSLSIALGTNTIASGDNSTAMGSNTSASGNISTVMGQGTIASGIASTAMGEGTTSTGYASIAMGSTTTAEGDYSMAMGFGSLASGSRSIAMGLNTVASGENSTAIGALTTATGARSMAMGELTIANGFASTVLGMYNDTIVSTQTSVDPLTPLFIIGNGDFGSESNAMVVRKDGKVGIGTNTPGAAISNALVEVKDGHIALSNDYGVLSNSSTGTGFGAGFDTSTDDDLFLFAGGTNRVTVDADGTFRPSDDAMQRCGTASFRWSEVWASTGTIQTSDARYKENVLPLKYGLSEIRKMRPVQYQWRNSLDQQKYVGLIAQEVQEIIPEVIRSSNEDHLGMNYAELVPVLINAVKELSGRNDELNQILSGQQEVIDSLQKKNERLDSELDSMKRQVAELFEMSRLDQNENKSFDP